MNNFIKISSIVLIFMIISSTSLMLFYIYDTNQNSYLKEKAGNGDYKFLLNYYAGNNPSNYDKNDFVGNQNTSITIIGILNPASESSVEFMEEFYPFLEKEYINTGQVKFSYRNYITQKDIEIKNNYYKYATLIECAKEQNNSFEIVKDIYSSINEEKIKISKESNINLTTLNNCTQNKEFEVINQDALNVRKFGIIGINPCILIGIEGTNNQLMCGIPSQQKINKTIKNINVRLGN
ncbi:DsbA family protein [Candidatus Woesearchaeota archaeon]|nr:DsbA family protein [Candidatus Woesearchaeota archaeon]